MLYSVTECYIVLQSVTECYRVFLAHLLGPIFGLVFYDLASLPGRESSSVESRRASVRSSTRSREWRWKSFRGRRRYGRFVFLFSLLSWSLWLFSGSVIYFYLMLCIMISHLCQDQIELDLAEKEKEVEESEKNILNYQQTIRVSFFNKDLIWLISLWLMLEQCNLWLSTPGANSSTGTLGHQPLGREKTQGGRISSGCEVGFIIIC